MDSIQLSRLLGSDPMCKKIFGGVYAVDELPERLEGRLLMVNTDIAAGIGQHWTVVYTPVEGGTAEFFDSTGHGPEHYRTDILHFLINNGPSYKFQTRRLQSFG